MPPHTLNTLRHLQSKIRLIRAIHLYKLKFEKLGAEEERCTRLELSDFDLLQEEIQEYILALTTIWNFLKEGKTEEENQKAIKSILSQLPQITREMHLFVRSLDTHSQNIQDWLQKITPEIPSENLHFYKQSTSSSQANYKRKSSKQSTEEIVESFNQYAVSLKILKIEK